jgi:hypothetical protein
VIILKSILMTRNKSVVGAQKPPSTSTIQVLGDETDVSVSAFILTEQENQFENLYVRLFANWVDCSSTSMVCIHLIYASSAQ